MSPSSANTKIHNVFYKYYYCFLSLLNLILIGRDETRPVLSSDINTVDTIPTVVASQYHCRRSSKGIPNFVLLSKHITEVVIYSKGTLYKTKHSSEDTIKPSLCCYHRPSLRSFSIDVLKQRVWAQSGRPEPSHWMGVDSTTR